MGDEKEKEKTLNVKFTQSYAVQDGSGTKFEKDKVYELPEASAHHYVNRKVAEVVDEEPAEAPKPIRDESQKTESKDTDQAAEIRKMKRDELDALAAKEKIPLQGRSVPESQEFLIAELGKKETKPKP